MPYFTQDTFSFLRNLSSNNQREWFELHKQDYENLVRSPALDFISDVAQHLPAISPHFSALPKKVGGSLMRVQRDTRFGHDKTPYKTNIGIQFRHELGKDVHAPGFYLHIANDECFVGVGLWRPDASALGKIRSAIIEHPQRWLSARDNAVFKQYFQQSGERLSQAPRGYDKQHELIEDLKWKDFIALAPLSQQQVCDEQLLSTVLERFRAAALFMQFLCKATDAAY